MSDSEEVFYRALSELVSQVDAKITVRKDPAQPYVGLEHIPSRGAHLTGWSLASSSISTNSIFQAGDILFGKLRPNLRKCVVAPFNGYCSTDILILRSNTGFAPSFAGKVLRTEQVGAAAEMTSVGTKMPRTSWKSLSELEVFCPGFPEQSKIAEVLDTLDTAIHETEAIIAKLKAVKQGLLHDLLTRGIDANGELRPPQSEAPHLYKQSPLGWIPKVWGVDAIEKFLDRIIDYRGKTPEKTESGVPLITAKNVRLGYIDPEPREFIALENFERWMSRGIPQKGDVLFTTEAPLGNVAQIETYDRLAFAQRMIILQTGSRLVNSFLKYLLLGETFRARLFALGSGSTVEGIQQSTFRRLLVAIPGSLVEQSAIVEMLINLDSKINYESSCMEKLKQTKAGLMDDLLTGRVRVTPLLEATP